MNRTGICSFTTRITVLLYYLGVLQSADPSSRRDYGLRGSIVMRRTSVKVSEETRGEYREIPGDSVMRESTESVPESNDQTSANHDVHDDIAVLWLKTRNGLHGLNCNSRMAS